MKKQATVDVSTWFREGTGEWVCDVNYKVNDTEGTGRYTGATEIEARNAGFAALGYLLLSTTFDD